MKIGEIKKLSGSLNADSATVVQENDIVYLETDSVWNPVKINLSKNLARIESGSEAYTSAGKVIARTALAGMAGSAWKSGSGGWSGIFGGLASSFGTTSERGYIVITLLDGNSIAGYTTDDVINFLASGSPSLSDDEIIDVRKKREKLDRYIQDSARTVFEVKEHITELKATAEEFKILSEQGESFDERDEAREKYFETNNELAEQESLFNILDERNRAIAKFGSVEKYEEERLELAKRVMKYRKKSKLPWVSLLFVSWMIYLAVIYPSDEKGVWIFLAMIFFIYPAKKLIQRSDNQRIAFETNQQFENLLEA